MAKKKEKKFDKICQIKRFTFLAISLTIFELQRCTIPHFNPLNKLIIALKDKIFTRVDLSSVRSQNMQLIPFLSEFTIGKTPKRRFAEKNGVFKRKLCNSWAQTSWFEPNISLDAKYFNFGTDIPVRLTQLLKCKQTPKWRFLIENPKFFLPWKLVYLY